MSKKEFKNLEQINGNNHNFFKAKSMKDCMQKKYWKLNYQIRNGKKVN